MKLVVGKYYTVVSGRFIGVTGVAVEADGHGDAHAIYSPDLPDDGVISFFNVLSHLRPATDAEELSLRRRSV